MAEKGLIARGPVGRYRFPEYYMDVNGTRLELMTDAEDPLQVADAAELPMPGNPVSLTNFFGESFYYSCQATIDLPGGGKALFVSAIEGVYATADESLQDGKQFVFSRLRWRVDTPVAGRYVIEHPWGTKEFENVPAGLRGINHTEDALHIPNDHVTVTPTAVTVHNPSGWYDTPLDPSVATIDTFCGWDADAPEGYIGDPGTLHTIRGSRKGFSHFKITGPSGEFQTDLFRVAGKHVQLENRDVEAEATLEFTIQGEATPGVMVEVSNEAGWIIATGLAKGNPPGEWRINQKFTRSSPLYPKAGDRLRITTSDNEELSFEFGDAQPIRGTGTLTVTAVGTALQVRPTPAALPGEANFVGQFQHLGGLEVGFPSTPLGDEMRFLLPEVPRDLFANVGEAFNDEIAPGAVVAVDLFEVRFSMGSTAPNDVGTRVGTFSADIQAEPDTNSGGVRQDVVRVVWSIPSGEFGQLQGGTRVEVHVVGIGSLAVANVEGSFAEPATIGFTGIENRLLPNALAATVPRPIVIPDIGGAGPDGQTGYLATAGIEWITLIDANDVHSAGTILLASGEQIVIPRNLIMALPANWLTLQQFVDQAPAREKERGAGVGHVATILGNRQANGIVVAGDVSIHKDDQEKQGIVTFINRAEGYFRVNGHGNDTGGTMVRINDPDGVHTVQTGRGVGAGPNGSPDPRYTNDPSNYTVCGTTGYPFGINGASDDFLPATNAVNDDGNSRQGGESGTAMDATKFEPLKVGDHVATTGAVETINGVTFQSAHTCLVGVSIATAVGDPDYTFVEEAEWDVAGWDNLRLKGFFILPMTSNEELEVTRLAHNGAADVNSLPATIAAGHEVDAAGNLPQFIAGTAASDSLGSSSKVNTVVDGSGQQVVKLRYDWDFVAGESVEFKNPRAVVAAAGDPAGLLLDPEDSVQNNAFRVFSPITREIAGKTNRRKTAEEDFAAGGADPASVVIDVRGRPAQWGFYVSPNGIGHPEMGEIDLSRFSSPFLFEGIPWNLDRRLSPAGGEERLADAPLGSFCLDPFPTSGFSPNIVSRFPDSVQPFRPTNISPQTVTHDIVTGLVPDVGTSLRSPVASAGAQAVIAAAPIVPAAVAAAAAVRAQDPPEQPSLFAPGADVVTVATGGAGAEGQSGVGVGIVGSILEIRVVDFQDRFSAGTITVAGNETIVIPRNLIIALPANWLTLQEYCQQAPQVEKDAGVGAGHIVTILANRQANGILVAGDVSIHKDNQDTSGIVTFIHSEHGYFRINGTGNDAGGTLVRLNDPDGVHSVQSSGPGVGANGANGSPDPRYTNDPANYTCCGTTGYPFGINGPNLPLLNSGRSPGDSGVVQNPTLFEPLLVGDFVSVSGAVETVNQISFVSAHTILVGVALATPPDSGVDYVLVEEAEWDVADWANLRLKGLNIGPMTSNEDLRAYRLAHNGAQDVNDGVDALHQVDGDGNLAQFIHGTAAADALGANSKVNTVVNDAQGNLLPDRGQVVKLPYDFDFVVGESKPFKNPRAVVSVAGDPAGLLDPLASESANAFRVFAPIAREIVYKTRFREDADDRFQAGVGVDPGLLVVDVQGNPAQWGFYVSPNGVGHPEMGEIDLQRFNQPLLFEGQLWNLDRRLGPVGGDEPLANAPLGSFSLDPFPTSGRPLDAEGDEPFRPTNISAEARRDPVTGVLVDVPRDAAAAAQAAAAVLANASPVNFNTNVGGFILDRPVRSITFGVTADILPVSADLLPLDVQNVEALAGDVDLLRQDYVVFRVSVSGSPRGLGSVFLRSVDAGSNGGLVELQALGVGYFRLGGGVQDGSGGTDTYAGALNPVANTARRSGFSFVRNGGGAGLSGLSLPLVVTYPRFSLPGQYLPGTFGAGISVVYVTPFGFNFLRFVLANISTALP